MITVFCDELSSIVTAHPFQFNSQHIVFNVIWANWVCPPALSIAAAASLCELMIILSIVGLLKLSFVIKTGIKTFGIAVLVLRVEAGIKTIKTLGIAVY